MKAQVQRGVDSVRDAARKDKRIEAIAEDLPTDEHLRLFASADACLAPSRWEGLGLHLFEATALGLPIVTNDNPPMNEVVEDGRNGLLVPGKPSKQRPRSDIGSFDPDRRALTKAIERLRDPDLRARLQAGALAKARGALVGPHRRCAPSTFGDWRLSERTLVREQFFAQPVDEVFEPFSRAENLQAITPPWLHFQIVSQLPVEMREGALIEYKLRFHGVPSAGGPRSSSGTHRTASSTWH